MPKFKYISIYSYNLIIIYTKTNKFMNANYQLSKIFYRIS